MYYCSEYNPLKKKTPKRCLGNFVGDWFHIFSLTNNPSFFFLTFKDENGEVIDPSIQDGTYTEKENLYEPHNLSTEESSSCVSTVTSIVKEEEEEEEMEVQSPVSSRKGTILV